MTKKIEKISNYDEPKGKTAAIVILLLMVFSIAGFAVLMGGPQVDNNTGNSQLPAEVPMSQIFQNPQTGETYLGTVRNNEQFIFPDISGYDADVAMNDLAENLKSKDIIEIYVDTSFNSTESVFLIEKALTGIKKIHTRTTDKTCTKNKLILTNKENSYIGCAVFTAAKNDEYRRSDILVYNLVK